MGAGSKPSRGPKAGTRGSRDPQSLVCPQSLKHSPCPLSRPLLPTSLMYPNSGKGTQTTRLSSPCLHVLWATPTLAPRGLPLCPSVSLCHLRSGVYVLPLGSGCAGRHPASSMLQGSSQASSLPGLPPQHTLVLQKVAITVPSGPYTVRGRDPTWRHLSQGTGSHPC